jgi:hypothetical protein
MQCPNTFGTLLEHHYYSARKLTMLLLLNKKMQILICIQVNKQAFFLRGKYTSFWRRLLNNSYLTRKKQMLNQTFLRNNSDKLLAKNLYFSQTIQQPCCPKNINTFSILLDPHTSLTMKFSPIVDLIRWPQLSSFSDKRCLVAPREAF